MSDGLGPEEPWRASVALDGWSASRRERVLDAMRPESGDLPGKSSVALSERDGTLSIEVTAGSTSALRAALNSYLRWLEMAVRVDSVAGGDRAA